MHSITRETAIFYPLVTVLTAIDMAMMIGLFWSSLQNTGSPLTLGLVLCLSVLLPFGLQRLRQHRGANAGSSCRGMLVRRLGGYSLVCTAVAFGALHAVAGFVAAALVMGALGYFTTSTLEALNTRLTLAIGMPSERAARWMQTAMQLGASGGAALGGTLLHQLGIDMFALSLGTMGVVTALLGMLLPIARTRMAEAASTTGVNGQDPTPPRSRLDTRQLKELSLTLGVVGFHIGAFNTLTPMVYQSLNQWSAADFGMASAVAGAGAFAAALLPRVRVPDYVAALLIIAMDSVLVFAGVSWISILACFGIGFGINHLRIGLRKRLIDLATQPADADQIASVSAFHYLLMQSAAPLLLSAIVSARLAGQQAAPWLFVFVAFVLLFCLQTMARPMCLSRTTLNPPK